MSKKTNLTNSSKLTEAGDETEHTLFVGAPTPIIKATSGTKTLATDQRKIAIGSAYYSDSRFYSSVVRVSRFMAGYSPKTVDEIQAIYERAKVWGGWKGVSVL